MASPDHFAITLILCAAVLHALWNAMVKGAADRNFVLGLISAGHAAVGIILVSIYALPARDAWWFIVASTFIHFFYYGFLLVAYRTGDFSQVYPIARGVAPVLVSIGAWLFANEVLPPLAWAAVFMISSAIAVQAFGRRKVRIDTWALLAALLTGLTIASYSVVDGLGVRLSGSPLGYIGWLFLLEGFAAFGLLSLSRKPLRNFSAKEYLYGLTGGVLSSLAYGLAIYAKSLTTLGTVSAIRESSVIIAALIGVIWFGERPWKLRIASAIVVVIGIILLANA
jgi:drug/metabolite transporter (DMT)-like permease